MDDHALNKLEAGKILGQSPKTLADSRWRRRVGLKAIKIGRSLRFLHSDLRRLLSKAQEKSGV